MREMHEVLDTGGFPRVAEPTPPPHRPPTPPPAAPPSIAPQSASSPQASSPAARPPGAPLRGGPRPPPPPPADVKADLASVTGRTTQSHRTVFLRQLPFAVVTMAAVAGVFVLDPALLVDDFFFAGVMIALAATTLSLIVPWRLLPRWTVATIPLLDMVGVAVAEMSGFHTVTLLVLPVLWLATSYGARGTVVAIAAGTIASWSDELLNPSTVVLGSADRLLITPAVLTAVAIYVHVAERRSSARREILRRQGALIEETLDDARDQHQLLRAILHTVDVGVVALDADGRLTIINRAHAVNVGSRLKLGDHVTAHAGIGGYAADGVTALGQEGSPLFRAGQGDTVDRELTWWDQGDGTRKAFRVSTAPLTDEDGTWAGAVVAYQDLTDEMNALTQREDFVSSVSHELRTPLTSVLGYLEIVRDDPDLAAHLRAHLDVVARNTERLERLISDLLTAAQTRAGAVSLHLGRVDLGEVVAEAVQSQGPQAAARGVTVLNEVTGTCVIDGDRMRLTQVVDNILSNAIKYSRPGGRATLTLVPGLGTVRLSVADDGIGVAPDDQPQLFARFYRADAVRRGPVPGTGLGLHISRLIIEGHGGTVELTSTLGVGTVVDITLPTGELP